jgi:hypothetical protein
MGAISRGSDDKRASGGSLSIRRYLELHLSVSAAISSFLPFGFVHVSLFFSQCSCTSNQHMSKMTTTHAAELNSGVWTSWLPVTTAWPSQAACNSEAWARYGIQATNDFWPYIYDPAYAQSVANSVTCLPPQATSWWGGGSTVSQSITSYSIGPIVCPAAYTTYSTSIVSGSSTSVICCPTYVFRPLISNDSLTWSLE